MSRTRLRGAAVFWLELAAIALVLGLCEATLRWRIERLPPLVVASGREFPPYYHNPGVVTTSRVFGFNILFHINALGLRGPDISLEKPRGTRRILVLGDSLVFGQKVLEEQTFPVQLERLLDGGAAGPRWQVLNAGVGSYSAWDYAAYLREKGLSFAPDIVVVGLCLNDNLKAREARVDVGAADRPLIGRLRDALLRSAIMQYAVGVLNRHQTAQRPLLSFRKRLPEGQRRLIDAVYRGDPASAAAVKAYLEKYRYEAGAVTDYFATTMDLARWKATREPLAGLRDVARARGVKLLAVVFPAQFEVYPGYRFPEPERTIMGLLASLRIPAIDLRPVYASTGAGDELFEYRYDTGHPNAKAYALTAAAVRRRLLELGWLAR